MSILNGRHRIEIQRLILTWPRNGLFFKLHRNDNRILLYSAVNVIKKRGEFIDHTTQWLYLSKHFYLDNGKIPSGNIFPLNDCIVPWKIEEILWLEVFHSLEWIGLFNGPFSRKALTEGIQLQRGSYYGPRPIEGNVPLNDNTNDL